MHDRSGKDPWKRGISAALAIFLQIIMQAEMNFFGEGFGTGVFEKADGLLEGIHEDQAGVAVGHVLFQVLAEFRVQLAVDVFG